MTDPLVVVGDVLWDRDLCGTVRPHRSDDPAPVLEQITERARPGGAGLAALFAALDGTPVVLVTALGTDPAAASLRTALAAAGVELATTTSTGATAQKVRVLADGRAVARLDHGGPAGRTGPCTPAMRRAIEGAGAVLVADYGRGLTTDPAIRTAIADQTGQVPVIWDPHPSGPLPVPAVSLTTPSFEEARHFASLLVGPRSGEALTAGRSAGLLCSGWDADAVAVTLGGDGAALATRRHPPRQITAPHRAPGDSCGAGDRFAVTAATLLRAGAGVSEAVTAAVAHATQYVAIDGPASLPDYATGTIEHPRHDPDPGTFGSAPATPPCSGAVLTLAQATVLAESHRAAGHRVVVTNGCFDLLHRGHVACLQDARNLGDVLFVGLNSDASVHQLKGARRPVNNSADRATVLASLRAVDYVVTFEGDTATELVTQLRPHVYIKGADYQTRPWPEADIVRGYGGQARLIDLVAGHSTSAMIARLAT